MNYEILIWKQEFHYCLKLNGYRIHHIYQVELPYRPKFLYSPSLLVFPPPTTLSKTSRHYKIRETLFHQLLI